MKSFSKIILITFFLLKSFGLYGQCSGPNWVPYVYCGGPSNGCYPQNYIVKYGSNYYKSKYNFNGNVPTNTGWWTKLTCCTAPSTGSIGNAHTICSGGDPSTISSTNTGGANVYQWQYSNNGSSGWTDISGATGVTYNPPSGLTANRWYRRRGRKSCSTTLWSGYTAPVMVTVTALPIVGTVTGASRCGTGTVNIQAIASAGSIQWFTASSGGSSIGSSSSGVNWATPSISSTTTYYAQAINGSCISSSRTAVTATVTAVPTISGSSGGSRCGTGTVNIQATASAGSIQWFTASSGGSSIGSSSSGVNWATPSISSTTTYYAQVINGSCISSSRTAVTATVTAVPTISGSSGERCNSGTVDLSATASAGSINWYAASSGGASLGTGNNFTTPFIESSTTYYVDATSEGCTTASRTAVMATVNTATAGPGGVTDELLVWLKADDANLGATWEDHSCNGFDYTTVSGPTLLDNLWNDNPAIEILSGGFDAPAGAELGTDWTVFFVAAYKEGGSQGRLIDGHTDNYLLGFHSGYRNGIYWNGTPSEYNSGIATSSGTTDPHIFTYKRSNSNSNLITRVDGDNLKTFTATNSGAGIRLDINQGNHSDHPSQARIGEFIIFNKALTDIETQKVETYLATKYGVSKNTNDGGVGGDYISTNGTTYWDASLGSDYHNDVIVIGKDNSTLALQKQAKSYNDSIRVFVSNLASSNLANTGTINNNNSFIAIGHNKGKLKATTTSNLEKPFDITSRLEREWKITNTNFTNNFSIEIEWDSSGSVDLSHLRLLVDDDGDFSNASYYGSADGLTFSLGSIIIGGIDNSIISSGSTKYITLGSVDELTTLPVELLYFKANEVSEGVLLSWKTAMEINNDYFILEKSLDGLNWFQIATVSGAGNSVIPISYTYIDTQGCNGNCYYQLTQVDFDGQTERFEKVLISTKKVNENFSINVNPNPIQNNTEINFEVPENGDYNFKIVSTIGQIVFEKNIEALKGKGKLYFDSSQLSKGIYYFILQNKQGDFKQQKLLK